MKETKDLFTVGKFSAAMNRLYENEKLSEDEGEYILGCALLLLDRYNQTENREIFELAYNIVLRYSLNTGYLTPLYDVSCNYGFYPTVRFINKKGMIDESSIENALIDFKLEHYKIEDYIETFEQYKSKTEIINAKDKNISFIAPTSSGKSSLILRHMLANQDARKTLVLVPTKSLISQTYVELRDKLRNRKIICHDAMYKGEECFVGVMTQERALRFLTVNEDISFDIVYVDEAHNIFSNDPRNVLLSRVLKICKQRNEELQTIYLSPFVNSSENLLQGNAEEINEQRIEFNIKEPNIFELDKEGNQFIYDRFADRFYSIGESDDPFEYVKVNEGRKNFFFINSPKKIEKFAAELYEKTERIEDNQEINELQRVLSKNIHPDFKMIRYLTHGIVYLHAKIPDQIKEFLEEQFKRNVSIKYLVANSVILEGINLPIDRLFVFDVWGMSNSKLLNLMGRVNRLNNVYDIQTGDLRKLLPDIHFVSSGYCRNNMGNKIKKLYQPEMDEVVNPLLDNCSTEGLKKEKKKKIDAQNQVILEQEEIFFSQPQSKLGEMQKALIAGGMNQLINVSERDASVIISNIERADKSKPVLNLVRDILLDNVEVIDFAFGRLRNDKALHYYAFLLDELKQGNLMTLLASQLAYYEKSRFDNPYMYIGTQYGEINPYADLYGGQRNVYIDLRNKNTEELVNLLIVKTKIEQDFIGFQYNRAVGFLHDYQVITDDQYNMEIYGTMDEKQINMLNYGISMGALSLLSKNDQLKNIHVDDYGNLVGNSELYTFRGQQDLFVKFELDKYIYFEK